MSLLHRLRESARRVGVDIARYPENEPAWQVVRQMQHRGVTVVVDIGANDGGYARELRRHGYGGRIVSFEPVFVTYERALREAASDPLWDVHNCALGPASGIATINVAGNTGASSSLLPMLPRHEQAAPQSAFVATEEVRQQSLDDLWPTLVPPAAKVLVKLDVQGYEKQVLQGATRVLESGSVLGLQMELSLQPLYAGSWLYLEALQWAVARGYELCHVIPGFADPRTGQLLQVDGVFFRPSAL